MSAPSRSDFSGSCADSKLSVIRLGALSFKTSSQSAMIEHLIRWLENNDCGSRSIGYINPHVFNLSVLDAQVRNYLSDCDLVCVDGVGVSAGLRWGFGVRVHRVVAEELFYAALANSRVVGRAILVGVEADEIQQAAINLNKQGAGITITAWMDGFIDA